MTIAEIHGKISAAGTNISERMEDLLTSDVFGCLRYLPPGTALLPFLRTGCTAQGKVLEIEAEVVRLHASFWPWLRSPSHATSQPDVVLGLETPGNHVHLVAIEAKYFSGLSSEEDEGVLPGNQLARELDGLDVVNPEVFGWPHSLRVASRKLLFVTQDTRMPRAPLGRALHEFAIKRAKEAHIFWTSWRFLPRILESALTSESDQGRRAVLEDIHMLLVRKGLVMFHGMQPVTQGFRSSDFEFYEPGSRAYQWPNMLEPPEKCCEYMYQTVGDG